jgi:hypothetical protein
MAPARPAGAIPGYLIVAPHVSELNAWPAVNKTALLPRQFRFILQAKCSPAAGNFR